MFEYNLVNELEELLKMSAHDFKSSARKIGAFTKVVQKIGDDKLSAEDRDALGRLLGCASKLDAQVDAFQRYARVSSHSETVETIDLKEMLNLSFHRIRKEGDTCALPEELPTISGNKELLGEFFEELLGNSDQYRKGESFLELVVSLVDSDIFMKEEMPIGSLDLANYWIFSISDNGKGVDVSHGDKIYKPYYKSYESKGVGLGLSICTRILNRHNAYISHRNKTHESGCVFYLIYPRNLKELN